jgi:hypothetical protein
MLLPESILLFAHPHAAAIAAETIGIVFATIALIFQVIDTL